MNRVHKSQVREILILATDLKNKLNTTYWNAGEDLSTHEEVMIKRTLAELSDAIKHLTEVI